MPDACAKRLALPQTQLLIVDVQERLLPQIADHGRVVTQAERMIRAAVAMELPITLSEQYPRGLGATVPAIAAVAAGAPRLEKTTFSFCADESCCARIRSVARPQVLLVGIEAHVCVYQTALDLLDLHLQPVVLADAVGSRRPLDYEVALAGLRAAGVLVTTVESAIFQLVHAAGTDLFKRILPLVK
jgi:nicotinamidase-related amidase